MKIVYIGPLWEGSTCLQRMHAMKELGHEIVEIDTEPAKIRSQRQRLLPRVVRRLGYPLDPAHTNESIIYACQTETFDVIWIDKGITVKRAILSKVKEIQPDACLVHYNTDDIMYKKSTFSYYLKSLDLYDVHFTTNKYNRKELENLGAKHVYHTELCYDPPLHRPMELSEEEMLRFSADVGFIGHWEPTTEKMILSLINSNAGLNLKVWGENWHKARRKEGLKSYVQFKSVWGENYAKAISATKINLCFLSKWNRNTTAARSFEIPACGGFLLAERTEEHTAYYEEGKEADFFSTPEELGDKVKFYIVHDDLRESIAQKGRERCLRSGYSWQDRMQQMMSTVESLMESQSVASRV
ncbi:glycosyltransferase [Candidatus Poribacteria bacterium]|nr:glycosyltransferase [Candidatus Poribacteria bacterium]